MRDDRQKRDEPGLCAWPYRRLDTAACAGPAQATARAHAALVSAWTGRTGSHQRLRSSAGRGERHYAAVARRIEIIAVIPARSFCHFCPGWPPGALALKSFGFSAWVRSAILPTWLRSGHFAVPPFCGQLLLDQPWPARPQPKPSLKLLMFLGSFCQLAFLVMPSPVQGIHVFDTKQDVDGRDKPGHDG